MEKIITLRYPAKCSRCKVSIPAGERAVWGGKGTSRHIACSSENVPSPTPVNENQSIFSIDFGNVKSAFLNIVRGVHTDFHNRQHSCIRSTVDLWKSDPRWVGCTIQNMESWLSEGFHVEGLSNVDTSLIQTRPKRRLRFTEDGDELLLDLAWSGSDEYFSDWEKRNRKPGLRIEIDISYSASNDSERIRPYLVWLARMLQTFDENAIDVEVSVVNTVKNMLQNSDYGKTYRTKIRVKNAGEAADFAAWSAMFSPGGFRQLMFTAMIQHGNTTESATSQSLGSPVTSEAYGIEYNDVENILYVRQTQRTDFPEFDMTEKLRAAMEKIQG